MDRTPCLVPFCRRTTKLRYKGEEWICSVHWPQVPTRLRRRKYWLFRRYRRLFGSNHYFAYPPGSPNRLAAVRLDRLCLQAWNACKKAAIERATGIG